MHGMCIQAEPARPEEKMKSNSSLTPPSIRYYFVNDLAEVRREVFSLLRAQSDIRFFAVVKDKRSVLDYVLSRNEREPQYRYQPNESYDYLVRRLFKNMLHKNNAYDIVFAKRGKSDRTDALQTAIDGARQKFREDWGKESKATIQISANTPKDAPGLQVADYFLWALQVFTSGVKIVILPISGPNATWCKILMTPALPDTACITHKKSR